MESGKIVEYIDREKIVCAVVLETKNNRLRLLSEANREVNLAASRLVHASGAKLDLGMGRNRLVETLHQRAQKRDQLKSRVDIRELWEVLNSEAEWIDLPTMTAFCFPENPDADHESAVLRTFFADRLYFKFKPGEFFPNPPEHVEQLQQRAREKERRDRLVQEGGEWLKSVWHQPTAAALDLSQNPDRAEIVEMLKSFLIHGKESPHYSLAKMILEHADLGTEDKVFGLLVRLGIWDENENIELYRLEAPMDFARPVLTAAQARGEDADIWEGFLRETQRRDLRGLPLITIDGQATLDFDDAISLEKNGNHYRLGVHIADVGHFIRKSDPIDQEAVLRGSSIYMADQKIPMLPACLAENFCSLKAGEIRPAISIMADILPSGEIMGSEIFPSVIRVERQLTYYNVNTVSEEDKEILTLYQFAQNFQQQRLAAGAVQITLPEINLWLDDSGQINLAKVNRESPGRMLVAEIMIMANHLMARYLAGQGLPAVFRSQPAPKKRLFTGNEGSLFQNWVQRKYLSRFILSPRPEHHTGLGLDAYVTATSPIRKFFDLVTQRQLRAAFGMESPYSTAEIESVIQALEVPMSRVIRLQYRRQRYWILKFLEGKVGTRTDALVLQRRRNFYQVLLTDYMLECMLPASPGMKLKPEDLIQVKIQHVNARKDMLSIFA